MGVMWRSRIAGGTDTRQSKCAVGSAGGDGVRIAARDIREAILELCAHEVAYGKPNKGSDSWPSCVGNSVGRGQHLSNASHTAGRCHLDRHGEFGSGV